MAVADGAGVIVDGIAVTVGVLTAGAQEARTLAKSTIETNVFVFMKLSYLVMQGACQRLALAARAGLGKKTQRANPLLALNP